MSEHLIIGKGGNGAKPADSDLIKETTTQNFRADVMETSRSVPVLVDFWAPWCGPCQMIAPLLNEIAKEGDGRFRIAKVNVDDEPALMQRFGIRGIPALLFFSGGELRHQIAGAVSKKTIVDKLAEFTPLNAL